MRGFEGVENRVNAFIEELAAKPFRLPEYAMMDPRAYQDKEYAQLVRRIHEGSVVPMPLQAISDPYLFGLALGSDKIGNDFVKGARRLIARAKPEERESIGRMRRLLQRMLSFDTQLLPKLMQDLFLRNPKGTDADVDEVLLAPGAVHATYPLHGTLYAGASFMLANPAVAFIGGVVGIFAGARHSVLIGKAREMRARIERAEVLLSLLERRKAQH